MKRVPVYLLCAVAAWAGQSLAESEFSLPDGFQATVFHKGLGKIRHIAVRDNGDVYVAIVTTRQPAVQLKRSAEGNWINLFWLVIGLPLDTAALS